MKIRAKALELALLPAQSVDSEDWVRVRAKVDTGIFSGEFEAFLQLEDLRRFDRDIRQMHASIGTPHEAELSCFEPDIYVRLSSQRLGGVEGSYRFKPERSPGMAVQLSGTFRVDQSYLPALAASVQALIEALEQE